MIRENRQKMINSISILLVIFIMLTCFSTSVFAMDNDTEDRSANILERILAGILKSVSSLIHKLLDGEGIGLDQLVYMNEDGPFTGLTLFKPGEAQDLLALFFNLFHYIALTLFAPIMFLVGRSISKAGDSPQEKSKMKDMINRVVLTIVFLYTMPTLLTTLVTVSNGFVDLFAGIGGSAGALVIDYIQLPEDYNLVDATTSAILVGVNIWAIGFYILRDLTICFLFVLFCVIAIWHPFSTDMVWNWWRVMASNVLAQPIQAFVLTIVLAVGNMLPTSSFAQGLYVVVAFSSIIPMTGVIKGLLRLETGIGAGNSRAGLGGSMAALMLARQVYSNLKGSAGRVIGGIRDAEAIKRENEIASTELNKNLSGNNARSTEDELNRPLINPNMASSTIGNGTFEEKKFAQENLERQNRAANRKMYTAVASGLGSAVVGTVGGAVGGIMGSAIGAGAGGGFDSNTARLLGMTGATMGMEMGYDVGSLSGHATGFGYDRYQGIQANKAMEDDIQDLQVQEVIGSAAQNDNLIDEVTAKNLINPDSQNYDAELANTTRIAAENKYFGIAGEKLDGTKWQAQERQALMQKKRSQNAGTYAFNDYLANKRYANLTPSRKSPEELTQITDASLYQDRERTIAYRPSGDDSYEILSVGTGNPYLSEPINNPISFQSPSQGMPNDVLFSIDSNAKDEAHKYMATAFPDVVDTSSKEYMIPFNEKVSEYKREMKHSYEDNLNSIRDNLGVPNMSIQTNETRFEELIAVEKKKEETRQLDVQQRKLEKMKEDYSKKTYQEYSRLSTQSLNATNIESLF